MKNLSRFLLLLAIVVCLAAVAKADLVDPAVGVRGDGDQLTWPGVDTFVMTTAGGAFCTGGFCDFTSPTFDSPIVITSFLFHFSLPQAEGFSSAPGNIFGDPTDVSPVPGTFTDALLNGGQIVPTCSVDGCGPNQATTFQLLMNHVIEGTDVTVFSNQTTAPVPEPTTIVLMLSGLGAMGLRRLRRKSAE